jgi:hypothetical protein
MRWRRHRICTAVPTFERANTCAVPTDTRALAITQLSARAASESNVDRVSVRWRAKRHGDGVGLHRRVHGKRYVQSVFGNDRDRCRVHHYER